ncbi:MAG TPA: hypothetical protein VJR89_39370, partial [Polyangiales bacterium]|nr:hypothetical protein [Polyangiales bacterium]
MRRGALLLLALVGCASTPRSPFFGDERYLRFGVDPYAEAEAVIEGQKGRGYPLAQRVGGENFIALGFMDKGGRSSAVRILTVRGIAVALDDREATPFEPGIRYALLAGPVSGTQDADRDGFEEVFVEQRSQGEVCLRVYRVRDVGTVDPVLTDTQVLSETVCPRAAVDLDGDRVVELLTEVPLNGFDLRPAPRLLVPLWADQHRFVARAQTAAQRSWVTQQKKRREVELQEARARLDYKAAFARAVELSAFAYLEGADPKGQVAVFDRALGGMVLEPQEAAANLRARKRIFDAWNTFQAPDAVRPAAGVHASVAPPAPAPEPEGDLLITPDSPRL